MTTSPRYVFLFCLLAASCTPTTTTTRTERIETISIPDDAYVVDDGSGRLSYTARRDGTIYLYDLDDRALMDSRPILRGQQYVAMPQENRAQLDGRTVFERDLKRNHVFRLYYLPANRREWDREDWRAMRLPRDANEVAGGRGQIVFRSDRDGRIWVYDADDEKVVFGRRIHRDDELIVVPARDRIEINGSSLYEGNLVHDHTHRIYFDRD